MSYCLKIYIYIDVGILIWVGLEFGTLLEMR